jgi:hypothetical protein
MSTTLSSAVSATFQGSAPANQVTTVEEARSGKAADGSQAPQGTTPMVVEPGDTISGIMAQQGLDWNDPAQRAQFLQDNPQFADQAGGRNPDLIWPGEVLYVRNGQGSPESQATDQAAAELAEAQTMSASTDSQVTHKENTVARLKTELEQAVRNEIAAGGDPAQIKERLKNDPSIGLDDQTIDQIVDAATQPASRTNPVGGAATEAAPLSPAHATNEAAAALSPSETGSGAGEKQRSFIDAAKAELEQGVGVGELKARYGNDPLLNGLIDTANAEVQQEAQVASAAETTDAAAQTLGETQGRSVSTDSQATGKDNQVARETTLLEFAVRDELAAGVAPETIKQRLKNDPNIALDDAAIDAVVDAATQPASRTNPVGDAATETAPLSAAYDTNQAAAAVSPTATGSEAGEAQRAFVEAARIELQQGVSVEELKARYGNDPTLNQLIDLAASGG